jgi:peptide/nickel transport system substrate-binding protein
VEALDGQRSPHLARKGLIELRRGLMPLLAVVTVLLVVIAEGAPGGAAPSPVEGGALRIALPKDLVTLDPTFALDNYSQEVIDQIFDTLVTYAPNGTLRPRLSVKWKAISNLEWEFTLRTGVKFHNGREMTADDVVWTMNRMLDPKTKVPRQHLFMVKVVQKTGPLTVRFLLDRPYSPFLSVLANKALSIIPREDVERLGDAFARNPVGTGPFKFVSWRAGEGVVLDRNPDYFFGRPYLDRVTFRPIPETAVAQQLLETGDVDVIADALPDDIGRMQRAGLLHVVPGQSYYYALFNLHPERAPIVKVLGKNPFLDKRVREAIVLSFPIDRAIEAVYPGLGKSIRAYGPLPLANWAYDPKLKDLAPTYGVQRAKQLLAEAGYPNGFQSSILSMNDAARKAMAEILQNSMAQIGVKVSVEAPEFGVLLGRANEQTFDIGVFGWGGSPDPHDFLFPLLHSSRRGYGGNNAYYSNPEVDRLIDRASVSTSQELRKSLYWKVQEIFAQDYVHIPLFYKPSMLGMTKRVQGLQVDPLGFFRLRTEDANIWLTR